MTTCISVVCLFSRRERRHAPCATSAVVRLQCGCRWTNKPRWTRIRLSYPRKPPYAGAPGHIPGLIPPLYRKSQRSELTWDRVSRSDPENPEARRLVPFLLSIKNRVAFQLFQIMSPISSFNASLVSASTWYLLIRCIGVFGLRLLRPQY